MGADGADGTGGTGSCLFSCIFTCTGIGDRTFFFRIPKVTSFSTSSASSFRSPLLCFCTSCLVTAPLIATHLLVKGFLTLSSAQTIYCIMIKIVKVKSWIVLIVVIVVIVVFFFLLINSIDEYTYQRDVFEALES